MSYAFTFDASACSGCKACQIACKDENDLPTGVLWRRVYEVSGGSWQQVGLNVIDSFTNAVPKFPPIILITAAALIVALLAALTERDSAHQPARRLRLGLTGIGLAGVLAIYFVPIAVGRWIMVPIFAIVLIEEGLGRWLFYKQLQRRNL